MPVRCDNNISRENRCRVRFTRDLKNLPKYDYNYFYLEALPSHSFGHFECFRLSEFHALTH